jgi:hypothetical protein
MFAKNRIFLAGILLSIWLLFLPAGALAHCDTLDGPVVQDARKALEQGNVTPTLKWVDPAAEAEIKAAFEQTVQVRKLGPAAQELADRYFFETLVRLHRGHEGEPFTGLKPAGEVPQPIAMADQALEKGSADPLVGKILEHTEQGIRERFAAALAAKKRAGESVDLGRKYVEDYVAFIHYVEGIVNQVHGETHPH